MWQSPKVREAAIRIYYRGPQALVTAEHFYWSTGPRRVFRVAELAHVQIVRVILPAPRVMRLGQLGVVAGAAGAVVVVTGGLAILATIGVGAALVAGIEVAARPARTTWELHARYAGAKVTLFATADEQEFRQVSRALRRTMEAQRT